jgi:DNA modification methylase
MEDEPFQLTLGDSMEKLKELTDNSIDSIVTDPPYALVQNSRNGSAQPGGMGNSGPSRQRGFMGHDWDNGEVAFDPNFWKECLRVLKPGGHLLAFGGSRTYHRLASVIEDAGFEIRDQIMWLYGQGFPKSLDVSKAIDGKLLYGGSNTKRLKKVNASRPGRGRARISTNNNGIMGSDSGPKVTKDHPATPEGIKWKGWGTALKPAHEPIVVARKPLIATVTENVLKHGTGALNIDACRVPTEEASGGRWPANVIHDGSDEVLTEFAKYGDKGNGWKRNYGEDDYLGRQYGGGCFAGGGYAGGSTYCDSGTAARFFYCAKASKKDRGDGNDHPTVKPAALMRYLVKLVTPPGGTVLDPFMGSGSTGKACAAEGFRFVGIEREREYLEIARKRVEREYALAV